jgi:hypothetical protein
MVIQWIKCSLTHTGVIQPEAQPGEPTWSQTITPTEIDGVQYDIASIQVEPWDNSAWSSGKVQLKWANRPDGPGPWYAYSPAVELTHTAKTAEQIDIYGQFLAVICTTAESGIFVNVYLHLRKT